MTKRRGKTLRYVGMNILLPILIFLTLIIGFFIGFIKFSHYSDEQNLILTKDAIRKSTIQCYAIEGQYPAKLSYLEDNYYLNIDYDRYYVIYDCIASNMMPEIEVFQK